MYENELSVVIVQDYHRRGLQQDFSMKWKTVELLCMFQHRTKRVLKRKMKHLRW